MSDYRIDKVDIEGFDSDEYTGIDISWFGDLGFGHYTIMKNIYDEQDHIIGDSEHMDTQDDKSFLKALFNKLLEKVEIVS